MREVVRNREKAGKPPPEAWLGISGSVLQIVVAFAFVTTIVLFGES